MTSDELTPLIDADVRRLETWAKALEVVRTYSLPVAAIAAAVGATAVGPVLFPIASALGALATTALRLASNNLNRELEVKLTEFANDESLSEDERRSVLAAINRAILAGNQDK